MRNSVHLKVRPLSVNLTRIGLLYIAAGAVQVWFWVNSLYLKHPTWVPTFLDLLAGGEVVLVLVASYLLLFWGITLRVIGIGVKLVWLSRKTDALIAQKPEDVIEMWKAVGLLAVVFFILFFTRYSVPDRTAEIITTGFLGTLMAGYSLLAAVKYWGKKYPKRR